MKYLLLIAVILLQACSTAMPLTAKFPEHPGQLANESCPALQKLPNATKLSEVAKTVTVNYTAYYECAVRLDAWIEWYQTQKNIFGKAAK